MAFISVITDKANSLTKHFELGDDGKLLKSAPGHLVNGSIAAFDVDPVKLVDLIKGLTRNQCLCLGVLDTPEEQPLVCGKLAKNGQPTRSKEFLNFFPGSSWLLLDFDDSGKSPEEAIEILAQVDPQIKDCSLAVVPSSSSYIYTEDGEEIVGEGNFHIFVELEGERDPKEYGKLLFDRLILNGLGTPYIQKSGAISVRSLFDLVVCSPEREIFSANPECKKPLVSHRLDHLAYQEGPKLNSDLIPELSDDDKLELRLYLKGVRDKLSEESARVRELYYKGLAEKKAIANGTTYLRELPGIVKTPIMYDKQGRPILELLSSEFIMDEGGNMIQIKDLLLNPVEGLKLPDPIEPYKRGDESKGIPGRGVATVLGNIIFSHSHCGVIHLMRWDADDVIDVMTDGDIEEKKFLWKALSTGAQELSSVTTDNAISDLADTIKSSLGMFKDARVGKEKKFVVAKLKVGSAPADAEVDKILDMNAKYGVVNMGGKTVIVSERWNTSAQEFEVEFSTPSSMDVLTKNQSCKIPGYFGEVSLYRYWEQHPDRRTYNGVVFEPNSHTFREPGKTRSLPSGDEYNLFQGYIYSPVEATNCDLILNHIKEVWCSGIEDEYTYVISWLAHLFQHPDRLSGTALILQSVPGAGKGIIIENCIVKPMGVHAISTSNSDDLTGRFNLHLGWNIFFYANEIAYTAQNSVKSLLKTLVETDTRTIEAKNVNKVKARNYSSIIFASNGDWVLNIDANDRRYVYLTVSSHKVGDIQYFKDLKKQIDNGGKDAFIKYLLDYDLKDYVSSNIPDRQHKQRTADFLRSAHPSVKFVWSLFDTDFGVAHFFEDSSYKSLKEWQDSGTIELQLTKSQLFNLYIAYCEYYKIERRYDDPGNITLQLEVGGVLKRETDNRNDFVMRREKKGAKNYFVICSVQEGKEKLRV